MFHRFSIFLFAVCSCVAWADEFTDLSNTFGVTTRLIGTHQVATNDPNTLLPINFWLPQYEGQPALGVPLSNPHMAQADAFGNIYIADKASHTVLKITTDGNIHTFAGMHTAGFNGDGPAQATTLLLNNTNGLFVFPNGVVYLLDPGNRRIRRVGTDGVMTTIVYDPEPNWYPSGRGLWVSPDEQLIFYTNEFAPVPPSIIADGAVVKKWTPTGGIEVICNKAMGFRNPANLAVNPVDGKLWVTDRAEEDATKLETGLFRIDAVNTRTRMTGNFNASAAVDGRLALNSFIDQPRGIAFLPNGAYFLCGHKEGSVWYVDTTGVLHKYLRGRGSGDVYALSDGLHPPLTLSDYFRQPRAVALAPNGNLLVVCCDSGFVFKVNNAMAGHLPSDLKPVSLDADGLHLNWSGLFSRGYRVQRTWSLLPADWQDIGASGGAPTGVPSTFVDPAVTGHTIGFYRLLPSL